MKIHLYVFDAFVEDQIVDNVYGIPVVAVNGDGHLVGDVEICQQEKKPLSFTCNPSNPYSCNMSNVHFLWHKEIPCEERVISKPRKYFKCPRSLMVKVLSKSLYDLFH